MNRETGATRSYRLAPYLPDHRAQCIAIFDSNLPDYVAEHERDAFAAFLDAGEAPYFVVHAADGDIVACGGYGTQPGRARLCWGLVRRDWQRRGVGRWMLLSRLMRIFDGCGRVAVTLDTSQKTCAFFARFGFRELERVPDGYWPGLDRVEMALDLDAVATSRLRSLLAGGGINSTTGHTENSLGR